MSDPRIEKLARVLVRYSARVKKGDLVGISGGVPAEPLLLAVYKEVLRAKAHASIRMAPEACGEVFLREANREQMEFVSPLERYRMKTIDVLINIAAPENTKALSRIDPKRQAAASQSRKPIMDIFFKRSAKPLDDPARLRWTGTLYPHHAGAQDAEMSLREYEDFVFRAGKLDHDDPVRSWKRLGTAQKRLCDFLNRRKEMRIRAPGGTDIRFGIAGRTWINCDGHENFPDGEVFTGPIENATEGIVHYSFPAVHGGREVNDIRLVFKAGKVVECSASHNEEFLIEMLDQDKGASVLGELARGSNYDIQQYSKNTLFDEKIGGTFHAAVGAAYPESGGTNKSGLHWDMVCDLRQGGVVNVDGEVISESGVFAHPDWPR